MIDSNQLDAAAVVVAKLTKLFGKPLSLALDDPAGEQKYLFFFEDASDPAIEAYLIDKGFAHRKQRRTPHDVEADIFTNEHLSARVEFSDPARNPDKRLWVGPLPESRSFRAFERARLAEKP